MKHSVGTCMLKNLVKTNFLNCIFKILNYYYDSFHFHLICKDKIWTYQRLEPLTGWREKKKKKTHKISPYLVKQLLLLTASVYGWIKIKYMVPWGKFFNYIKWIKHDARINFQPHRYMDKINYLYYFIVFHLYFKTEPTLQQYKKLNIFNTNY